MPAHHPRVPASFRRRLGVGIVGAALAAGCVTGPGPVKRPLATPSRGAEAAATPSPARPTGPDVPAGAMRGVVLGLDGAPAAGVAVRAYLLSNNGAGVLANNGAGVVSNHGAQLISDKGAGLIGKTKRALLQAAGEAKTGADGRFALAVPAGARVNVEAVLRDDVKAFAADAAASAEVRLKLAKTGTITGRIVAPAGSGVTDLLGADVFIPGSSYAAKCDRDGSFTITNVPEGRFTLVAQRPPLGEAVVNDVAVASERSSAVPPMPLVGRLPAIARLAPAVVSAGDEVAIEGANFGATTGEPFEVTVGGRVVASPTRSSDGQIRFMLPTGSAGGPVVVTVGGVASAPAVLRVVATLEARLWATGALRVGERSYVSWRALDPAGQEVPEAEVVWTSGGEAVTVDGGAVTAEKPGTSGVTLAIGKLAQQVEVEVTTEPTVRTFVGYPEPAYAADDAARTQAYARFRHRLLGPGWPAEGNATFAPWGIAVRGTALLVPENAPKKAPTRVDLATGEVGEAFPLAAFDPPTQHFHFVTEGLDGALYASAGLPVSLWRLEPGPPTRLIAGTGKADMVDGPSGTARVGAAHHFAVERDGTIYFSDEPNDAIRKRAPDGTITTLVGGPGKPFGDGPGATVGIDGPTGVAFDGRGGLVVLAGNERTVKRVGLLDAAFPLTSLAGGGACEHGDGTGAAAKFCGMYALAVDPEGRALVTENFGAALRIVTPEGAATTLVGGRGMGTDDGPASQAKLNEPVGLALDPVRRYVFLSEPNRTPRAIRLVRY